MGTSFRVSVSVCTKVCVMSFDFLEWKLVRETRKFASSNNPEGTVRVDTEFNMSAIDLVSAFCRAQRKAASKTIQRLLENESLSNSDMFYADISWSDRNIPLIPYRNAVKLMMLLPGKNAAKNREKFAEVLHQHYASDDKPMEDIDKNEVSNRLFEVMARATLAALLSAQTDQAPAAAAAASSAAAAAS